MKESDEAHLSALRILESKPEADPAEDPLGHLVQTHTRKRVLCFLLEEMADAGTFDARVVRAATKFLKIDFGLHIGDEEQDLFPMLRQRLSKDRPFLDVLKRLSAEHAADSATAQKMVNRFSGNPAGKIPSGLGEVLMRFSKSVRHHLMVENALVIPLSRATLAKDDLVALGRHMAARRMDNQAGDMKC